MAKKLPTFDSDGYNNHFVARIGDVLIDPEHPSRRYFGCLVIRDTHPPAEGGATNIVLNRVEVLDYWEVWISRLSDAARVLAAAAPHLEGEGVTFEECLNAEEGLQNTLLELENSRCVPLRLVARPHPKSKK